MARVTVHYTVFQQLSNYDKSSALTCSNSSLSARLPEEPHSAVLNEIPFCNVPLSMDPHPNADFRSRRVTVVLLHCC